MHRYIALVWNPAVVETVHTVDSVAKAVHSVTPRWQTAFRSPGLAVFHTGSRQRSDQAYPLAGRDGVVLGTLFRRYDNDHTNRQYISFDEEETRTLISTTGRHLIERYWGTYVAFIQNHSASCCTVLRDPSSALACYVTTWGDVTVFFSHIADVAQFIPKRLSFNPKHMTSFLMTGDHLSRECGLVEIEDIPGGESLTVFHDKRRRTVLWHPYQFFQRDPIEREEEAAQLLNHTVHTTVNAWASCYSNLLMKLSGGLDSSVVAGCVAQAPCKPTMTGLNFFVDPANDRGNDVNLHFDRKTLAKYRRIAGHADERRYARQIAAHWNFSLTEYERLAGQFQLSRIYDAPLSVRPSRYFYFLDTDDAISTIAKAKGAEAVFSGMAGDVVFFNALRSWGAVDYAYAHPFGHRLGREIANAAVISGDSVWNVLEKTLKYGYLRKRMPPSSNFAVSHYLLQDDVVNSFDEAHAKHPWLSLVQDVPPAKLYQIGAIASPFTLQYSSRFHSNDVAASIDPLTSQPVLEACLQIPSYVLLAGGVSRGLARRAFADLLPTEVRTRVVKGSDAPLVQRILRTNMKFLRETLIDGLLVKNGFLNRQRLSAYLTADQTFVATPAVQLVDYLAAECWLRQWTSVQQSAAA